MEIIPKRDEACVGIPSENRAPSKPGIYPLYTKMGMLVHILMTVGSACVLGKVTVLERHAVEYRYGGIWVNFFAFLASALNGGE
jgi:hypothetical protein